MGQMAQMNQMARRDPVYSTTGRRGDKYYTYVLPAAGSWPCLWPRANNLLAHYRLQIEQQPDRARMCGFGDKVGAIATGGGATMRRHHTHNERALG